MTGDNRYRLPDAERAEIKRLYATDMLTRDIAERFDVSEGYVRSMACRAGVRKGKGKPAEAPTEPVKANPRRQHLVEYKRAHRGFYMPSALEPAYTDLLLTGLSRHAAAVQLGLKGGEE